MTIGAGNTATVAGAARHGRAAGCRTTKRPLSAGRAGPKTLPIRTGLRKGSKAGHWRHPGSREQGARRGAGLGLAMAGEVTVDAAHRITELREVDVDALLGRAENTSELLDYTGAQQHELLGRVWIAITDVAASSKRTRMRESRLRRSADRLQRQAGQAAAAGREEYARQAMAWRGTILRHVAELTAEQAALRASEGGCPLRPGGCRRTSKRSGLTAK